jgi:hypothetical protein
MDRIKSNGRKDVLMQRTRTEIGTISLALAMLLASSGWHPARADVIRGLPGRSYPDIAGDLVGTQTYTYDPLTQTGTFALNNAPHLISLGPSPKDLFPLLPDRDGTLMQTLRMTLDRKGHLIESPGNRFEIRGTVVIGDQTYQGILLEGKPTAFGAETHAKAAARNPEVFDLNMRITGGKLADAFGPEAHLRIVPQRSSTFSGEFTHDFSGEKPLTNLRSTNRRLPAPVPEPTTLVTLLACGAGLLVYRLRRSMMRAARRRRIARRCCETVDQETLRWL